KPVFGLLPRTWTRGPTITTKQKGPGKRGPESADMKRSGFIFSVGMLICTCVSVTNLQAQSPVAERVTGNAVIAGNQTKGVALLAVRWDRRWNCGGFENAQLRVMAFDKLPTAKTDDAAPDLLLDDAPLIMTKPVFENYAFQLEPGEYGLSRLEIKVAKSVSDVGVFRVPRSKFLKDGASLGGTFTVGAGEVVYLGHFYLDCH